MSKRRRAWPYDYGGSYAPKNILGANLAAAWRSDLGITLGANGVAGWGDQSGNGIALLQATGASQPTYNTSGGVNGLPRLTFDGSSKFLQSTSLEAVTGACTIYAVATPSNSVGGTILGSQGTTRGFIARVLFLASVMYVSGDYALNSTLSSTIVTSGVLAVYSWVYSGSGVPAMALDTVAQTVSGSLGAQSGPQVSTMVGALQGVGQYWPGDIYEIIVANAQYANGGATDLLIRAYLNARYGRS